jgi:hypothetical protein
MSLQASASRSCRPATPWPAAAGPGRRHERTALNGDRGRARHPRPAPRAIPRSALRHRPLCSPWSSAVDCRSLCNQVSPRSADRNRNMRAAHNDHARNRRDHLRQRPTVTDNHIVCRSQVGAADVERHRIRRVATSRPPGRGDELGDGPKDPADAPPEAPGSGPDQLTVEAGSAPPRGPSVEAARPATARSPTTRSMSSAVTSHAGRPNASSVRSSRPMSLSTVTWLKPRARHDDVRRPRGGLLWVQRIGLVDIERLSTVGNTRCTVLLDHSSPTETGLRGSYLRDSRHMTVT